jgi:hypothetical protein
MYKNQQDGVFYVWGSPIFCILIHSYLYVHPVYALVPISFSYPDCISSNLYEIANSSNLFNLFV